MSSVLVTGATGFVGSHLARRLLRDGHDVHVLCRAQSDFWRLGDVLPRLHRHTVALSDATGLQRLVGALRPEYVFHLAAATVVAGSTGGPAELIGVNLLGSVNLIDACAAAGGRGLVTTGDSFEYSASHERLREAMPCRPDALHGITKLAATQYAQAVARAQGSPIVTLRLFSTYGPGDNPRRLVPRVISAALAGTPLLLSRPEIARDWVYIDDVVELYLEAARSAERLAGGVFNAGSGHSASLSAIVELVLRLTGSQAEIKWGTFTAPPHDDHPWIADPACTFAAFAWRPKTSLTEGLSASVAAARREAAP